jgi:hypothetical protein
MTRRLASIEGRVGSKIITNPDPSTHAAGKPILTPLPRIQGSANGSGIFERRGPRRPENREPWQLVPTFSSDAPGWQLEQIARWHEEQARRNGIVWHWEMARRLGGKVVQPFSHRLPELPTEIHRLGPMTWAHERLRCPCLAQHPGDAR